MWDNLAIRAQALLGTIFINFDFLQESFCKCSFSSKNIPNLSFIYLFSYGYSSGQRPQPILPFYHLLSVIFPMEVVIVQIILDFLELLVPWQNNIYFLFLYNAPQCVFTGVAHKLYRCTNSTMSSLKCFTTTIGDPKRKWMNNSL